MKYKLIAIDIDGTLLNSRVILPKEVKRALNFAKSAGVYVTLATGRLYHSAFYLAREVGINAPLVANDGAQVQDVFTGEVVYYRPLPLETARKVMEALKGRPIEFQVFLKDKKIYGGKNFRLSQLKKYFRRRRFTLSGFYNYCRDFIAGPVVSAGGMDRVTGMLREDPVKLVVYGRPEHMKGLKNELEHEFGNEIKMTSAVPHYIDILAPGVSKAYGLKVLGDYLNITPAEIIAVGDSFNDLEMIDYAGLGVVMGNAPQQLKERADYVTATNDENGIAQVVRTFIGDYTAPLPLGRAPNEGIPLR